MKTKVFISHSSRDKETAAEICRFLESNGVTCWIAPRNVMPGKNYGAAIIDAIDECGVFVLVLSGESNKSGQVVREVERAATANAVIIPFRIENVQPSRDLEFYVSSSHWLDAADKSLEKHLNELLAAIMTWHEREKTGTPSTQTALPVTASVSAKARGGASRPAVPILIAAAVIVLLGLLAYAFLGGHKTAQPQQPATRQAVAAAPNAKATSPSPPQSPAPAGPPVVIQSADASSELPPQTTQGTLRHFSANFAFDNDIATAWMPNKSGPGEWIQVHFSPHAQITSISVFGGIGLDASDLDRFRAYNRVRELRIFFPNGFTRILRLKDEPRFQWFELPAHPNLGAIKFEIESIYPGTKYDSTPISEIKFNLAQPQTP